MKKIIALLTMAVFLTAGASWAGHPHAAFSKHPKGHAFQSASTPFKHKPGAHSKTK
jgi:hypothetical protein